MAAPLSSFIAVDFGRVGAVGDLGRSLLVDRFFLAPAQMRQRLEAGDAEQPRRHLRAALETRGLLPQFEEDLVRDIVSHRFRSRLTRHEAVDPRVVAQEQEPDGGAVAARNPRDELAIGLQFGWGHGRCNRLAPVAWSCGHAQKVHGKSLIIERLAEATAREKRLIACPMNLSAPAGD